MSVPKNVRSLARLAALCLVASAAAAPAHALEGDATANSRKPVVGILNPNAGVVMLPFRVQVRVFSPKSLADVAQPITAVELEYQGGQPTVPLTRSTKYAGDTTNGIWEVVLDSSKLTAGNSYTLRVSATNGSGAGGSGTVWSGSVVVTVNGGRGDGNLLVRDNGSQLCGDCHAHETHSSAATGPKYGSWYTGCRSCHQPHDTTNASLIATQITPPAITSAQTPKPVVFATRRGYSLTGGAANPFSASFANADKTGVCQVCHTRTSVFRSDGTLTSHQGNELKNCATCHSHKKGFNVDCAGCHGAAGGRTSAIAGATDAYLSFAPPVAPTTTAPKVLNGGVHLDHVNADTYRRDALTCAECHLNYGHGDNDIDLNWGTITRADGATVAPAAGVTTAGWVSNPTCTNYCHGATMADGSPATKLTVKWNTPATLTCGSCHGNPPTLLHSGAAHPLSTATGCVLCHVGYENPLLASAKITHIDGIAQGKACTDCHGDASRTLVSGASPDARNAPPKSYGGTTSDAISVRGVGVHQAHVNDATAVATPFACAECHPVPNAHAATSGSEEGQVAFGTIARDGGARTPTWSYPTCTSTYCHNPTPATPGTVPAPSFSATATLGCIGCHDNAASLTSGSHALHVADATAYKNTTYNCLTCHAMVDASNGAITDKTKHVDGAVDTGTTTFAANSCAANYCHSDGTETAGYVSVTWGGADSTDNCKECHGREVGGIAGAPWYTNNASDPDTRNSHEKHVAAAADCVSCHPTTVQVSGALVAGGGDHLKNGRNVSPGSGITFTYDEASETCSGINCHGGGDAQWGATLACNGCHGNTGGARTPVAGADANLEASPPEGLGNETLTTTRAVGAHIAHANQISLRQNALACAECHSGWSHNRTKQVAWGTIATNGGGKSPVWDGTTCSNTYCHAPGGTEMGGSDRAPTWTAGVGEVACGTCHGMPAALDAGAGDHPQNTNCVACHGAGYVTSGITVDAKDTHVNQSTVAGTDKPNNGCTACHGVLAGVATAAVPNTSMTAAPGYNGAGVDTNGSTLVSVPSVGAHDAHVRPAGSKNSIAALDCSNCHGTKPADGTTTHADAAVGIGWGALATNGSTMIPNPAAFGAAFEASPNCSTVYCHSNATPLGGTLLAPAFSWTSAADMTCGSCHAVSAFGGTNLSAKHSKHLTGYTYTCDECHAPTMTDDSSASIGTVGNHVNRTKEVDFSAVAFPADTVNQQGGVYAGTPGYGCTSTYCHSNGTTTAGPAFGATTNPTAMSWSTGTTDADCDNCHGGNSSATYKLATGSHTGHVNAVGYLGTNLGCVTCHDATIGAGDGAIDPTTGFANHVDGQKDVDAASWSGGACGTNYCHSNGTEPTLVAADYKTATWGSAITDNCLACHGSDTPSAFNAVYGEPNYPNDTGNVKTRNSHDKHLSSVLATAKTECVNCHAATVQTSGALITDGLQHLDNTRDVSAGPGITFTYDEASETCTSISCHGNKTAQWGATLACGDCHGSATRVKSIVGTVDANFKGAPPVDESGSSTSQRVGAHLSHVDSDTYRTNGLACAECHPSTVQHNGTRDAAWNGLATTGGVTPTPLAGTNAYSTAWEGTPTCVNYCHGATLAGETVTAQWSATGVTNFNAAAACTQCHGASPATSGSPAVVHPSNTACASCHGTGYATAGLSATAKNTHVNGGSVGGVDKPNNGCTACHGVLAALGTAQGPTNFAAAPGYNGTGVDAAGNTSATVVQVGAHDAHVRDEGATNMVAPLDCNNCHVKPVANDRAHANNAVAMGWSSLATGTGAISPVVAPQWASPNCSSNYCHSNGKPLGGTLATKNLITWATAANMTCTSCHETAVFSGTGLSAKHQKHVSTYAYGCVRCHVNTVTSASNAIVAGGGQHVDGSRDVGFDATGPNNSGGGYNGVAYTCSNTYCHSSGADRNGVDGYTSGPSTAWNGTSTCASCHGYATTMVNNAHGAHTNQAATYNESFGCQTCHAGTTDGTQTITTIAKHVNAAADVDSGLSYVSGGSGGCTTYCHSAGTKFAGAANPGYFPKPWATPLAGCSNCHGAYQSGDAKFGYESPAGGPNYANGGPTSVEANNHNRHATSAASCPDCHAGTVNSAGTVITSGALHMDGKADIAFSGTWNVGAIVYVPRASATQPPTCTNVSCHLPPAVPTTWGGTIVEGVCSASTCHVRSTNVADPDGDKDDYIFLAGSQQAFIDAEDYATYGHGRATNFTGAGMSGNTGVPGMTYDPARGEDLTKEGCLYCHAPKTALVTGKEAVPHNDLNNPFRLANTAVSGKTWGRNGNCLVCHAPDALGYSPDGPLGACTPPTSGPNFVCKVASAGARVSATHYANDHQASNAGGEFCWDCHDPHGDYGYSSTKGNKILAYMLHEYPVKSHNVIDEKGWGLPDIATEFTSTWVEFNSEVNPVVGFDPLDYVDNSTTNGFNGVCQVCHTDSVKMKYYLAGTASNHMQGAQCTKCHPHDSATATTAFKELTACNGCHDVSPANSGEHALHVGAAEASAAYGSTSPASTSTAYGYNCGKCHATPTSIHYNDNLGGSTTPFAVNVAFDWTSGATPYTLGTATNDVHAATQLVYKTTTGTCATYCHSNGDPLGATAPAIAYQTPAPTWAAQAALPCTACHGGKDAATTMSPTHAKHINASPSYAYTCLRCHTPSINTDSTVIESQHVDGDRQDVGFNAPNASGSYVGGTYTCSTVYCHSSGTASPTYTQPNWTDAAYLAGTCTQCHAVAAIATTSHDEHVNNAAVLGANYGCVDCHNTVVSANTTLSNQALHVNGSRDVGFAARNGQTSAAYAAPNCASNYCHSSGRDPAQADAARYTSIAWGAAAIGCNGCHGKGNAAGSPDYADSTTLASANSHALHTTAGAGTCQSCHTGYVSVAGTAIVGSAHTDGVRNVAFLAAYDTDANPANNYDPVTKTCSSIKCHGTNAVVWGANGTMSCATCHGTSPRTIGTAIGVGDTNLVGAPPKDTAGLSTGTIVGPHVAHIVPSTANEGQIHLPIKCAECHTNAVNSYGTGHMSGARDVSFANAIMAKLAGSTPGWTAGSPGTCTSTYCHGDKLAAASRGNITTWSWGTTQTATCGSCHGLPPNPTSGTHNGVAAAATACVGCHTETVDAAGKIIFTGTGAAATTKHINGSVEGGGGCGGCHSKPQPTTSPRRRQTNASGGVGGDFKGRSHHVVGATPTTESIEDFDCIVCHAEGKVSAAGDKVSTSGLHNQAGIATIHLVDADSAGNWGGNGVDPAGTIYSFDATDGVNATEKADLDKFCLSCHDVNGALYTYNMNPADTAWHPATPTGGSSAGTVRPFGQGSLVKSASDSNLRGGTALLGGATRGTVVNVKSQFDPLGSYPSAAGGAGDTATWTKFSYHALVFFNQSRYTTAAPAYSIKNTHTFTTQAACADAVCDDTSKMYCSDCHRSTLNAHGGVNAEYLLRACDGAGPNGCATSDTNDALGSFGLGNAVCYRCHPMTKYVNKGAGGVHGPENAGDLTEVFGPPYTAATRNASKGTLFGLGCIHCHGGTTYGGIHGSGEVIPFANLATTRKAWRFMNGSSQSEYNPIDTNTAADTGQPGQDKARWATATGVARTYKCYTIGNAPDPAVSLGACGQHGRGTTNTFPTTDGAASRPLNY